MGSTTKIIFGCVCVKMGSRVYTPEIAVLTGNTHLGDSDWTQAATHATYEAIIDGYGKVSTK